MCPHIQSACLWVYPAYERNDEHRRTMSSVPSAVLPVHARFRIFLEALFIYRLHLLPKPPTEVDIYSEFGSKT